MKFASWQVRNRLSKGGKEQQEGPQVFFVHGKENCWCVQFRLDAGFGVEEMRCGRKRQEKPFVVELCPVCPFDSRSASAGKRIVPRSQRSPAETGPEWRILRLSALFLLPPP